MKKLLLTLAAVLASASAFAQGVIQMSNLDIPTGLASGGVYQVRFNRTDGTTGAGAGFTAGLFLQNSTTPLFTVGFRQNNNFGVFANLTTEVPVTGFNPGTQAPLQVKVWETAAGSYEAATIKTAPTDGLFTSQPLGGPNPVAGQPAFSTPTLTGLKTVGGTIADGAVFNIVMVPEPTTIALGVLGVGSLLLLRRRK